MSTDEDMPDDVYKYNVRPVIKAEYFEESLWVLIKKAEDAKATYDWQGDEIVVCSHPRSATCFPCTGWYNHIKAWEEYTAGNPDVPIMLQMYEDLVRKLRESLKRRARFLDIEVTEEFLNELVEASKFSSMRKTKVDDGTNEIFRGDTNASLLCKGVIGDWKNWLTVQNYEPFQEVFPKLSDDKLIFT